MTGHRQRWEQAVAAAVAGATVLTPNTRSARAIHAAADQRLRIANPAWPAPDVLPYGAFLDRLFSDAVVAGTLNLQLLQREQELELWRQIIEHSSAGRQMLLPDSAAALAAESFRTAIEYRIPLASPQNASPMNASPMNASPHMNASSESLAFSAWALEFQRRLAAHRWTCSALLSRELSGELRSCLASLRLPQQLFAFMPAPTPAQRDFLAALAQAGVHVTLPPPSPDSSEDAAEEAAAVDVDSNSAVRIEFDSAADELRAAALWARRQVEAAPQSRIAVLIFDLERKLPQVESAFRSVLHPEHLLGQRTASAFEIASPQPLASYPVIGCALRLLALFAGPIAFHSFHAMLTAPYLTAAPEAAARFIAQLRPHARRQVSLEDFSTWLHESKLHESNELPSLRAALDAVPKHSPFSSQQPIAYWADLSRRILQAFGWPAGVAIDSQEFQSTESWRDLLATISSLELLDLRTDFPGFVTRLQRAAEARNFKPESRNAPVQIMDLAESEGSVFDALWIASCTDDLWPDSPHFSPLIPVVLLKQAGVAVIGTPQAEARIRRITADLLQSAPRLVLSLALRTDDEREQRWSPLFAHIPAVDALPIDAPPFVDALPDDAPPDDAPPDDASPDAFKFDAAAFPIPPPLALQYAAQFPAIPLDVLTDSAAPPLSSTESIHGGSSLLAEQSACPFRAFATRRLLARQQQGPLDAIALTERGKIVERALQLIWEQLQDSQGLQRPDRPELIRQSVDQAMALELPASDDPWTLRFRDLERQRTVLVLTEWLDLEAQRAPFHVLGHQMQFEVPFAGLTLQGRLDRLDEIENAEVGEAHLVIDYKTGAANPVSAWRVPRPRLPQLPFYAYAMRRQQYNLAGIAFAAVRPNECGFKAFLRDPNLLPAADPTRRSFNGLSFDEYTPLWDAELERLAAAFVQGDAAVDPRVARGRSGSPCLHCHLPALCRVAELAEQELSDPESDSDAADSAAEGGWNE